LRRSHSRAARARRTAEMAEAELRIFRFPWIQFICSVERLKGFLGNYVGADSNMPGIEILLVR